MNAFVTLQARDGHSLEAYAATAAQPPRGGIVVLHEVFGVNSHICAIADRFAAAGYSCLVPSLFDRVRRGVRLEHAPAAIDEGIRYASRLEREEIVADVAAAATHLERAGRIGVIGYCLGGQYAYIAACDLTLACAVVYYGGNIPQLLPQTPRCPVLYHFAERDKYVPLSDVDRIRQAHPEGSFYVYPAEHGFASDDRAEYDAACAAAAQRRTLAFLARHVEGQHAGRAID